MPSASLAADFRAAAARRRPLALLDWCRLVSPRYRWDWPHIAHIGAHLQDVADGRLRRLMVFVPPRHGKSELGTIRFPGYLLERDPATRVIVAAYNQTLAEKFSRRTRAILTERGAVPLDPTRFAVQDWQTTAGGGVRAVGVGGGVTGMGGNVILIDDPVKSREEANSEAYRERCWDWYTNDLYTRQEPDAAIVLTMTRWHEDDLAGRILASDRADEWTVIRLPAEAEAGDPLGRAAGEALCRDRYDEAALADLRATLTAIPYAALFQQRPMPAEGGLFKSGKVEFVDAAPAQVRGRVRRWDVAATAGGGDWTAGVLLSATTDGRYVVEDVVRGQWGPDERDRIMRETAERDGRSVRVWVPQDPGAAGVAQVAAFMRLFAGFAVQAERESGAKEVRADPLASQWNAGNVLLLRAGWNRAFLDELTAFPSGKYDDQVDAAAGAFVALAGNGPVTYAKSLYR